MNITDDSAHTVLSDDSHVALLLKWMIEESKIMTPSVQDGRATYPDVTKLVPTEDPIGLLDQLSARGFLKKEYYASEVHCPKCDSSLLRNQYTCAFCQGSRLETGEMIDHYACGYVDFEAKFLKGAKLICPKCGKELKAIGTDYRRVGKVFKCVDCARDFSAPRIVHVCQNCGTTSTWEKARLGILYQYRINDEKKKDIESMIAVHTPLIEFLREKGFEVESPAFLKGGSGIEHSFDIAAVADGSPILFDIRTGKESVNDIEVISFFAKSADVPHREAILVAVPRATDRARGLSGLYGVSLLEGNSIDDILASMATLFLQKAPTLPKARAEALATGEGQAAPARIGELRDRLRRLEEEKGELPNTEARKRMGELHDRLTRLEGETAESEEESPAKEELRTLRARMSMLEEAATETSERNATQPEVTGEGVENQSSQLHTPRSHRIETTRTKQSSVSMDRRLLKLEQLRSEGKLGKEEYRVNRERIMVMIRSGEEDAGFVVKPGGRFEKIDSLFRKRART